MFTWVLRMKRYSLPQPNPLCPTPLEQSSTHLQVKEVQCLVRHKQELQTEYRMQKNNNKPKGKKHFYQEKTQTLQGNLFPLQASIPTLKWRSGTLRKIDNA